MQVGLLDLLVAGFHSIPLEMIITKGRESAFLVRVILTDDVDNPPRLRLSTVSSALSQFPLVQHLISG